MSHMKIFHNSYQVVQCIGGLVKTVLVANKCIKCVVADGETRYVRDTSLLLQLLDIEHPIGQYVVSVCRGFVRQYKTGGDTLLFFISSFMKAATLLTDQGIPTASVSKILQVTLEDIIEHVNKSSIPVNIRKESPHRSTVCVNTERNEKHNTTFQAESIAVDSNLVDQYCISNGKDEKLERQITDTQKSCIENRLTTGIGNSKELTVDDEVPVVQLQMKTNDVESEQELDWFFEGLIEANNTMVESVSENNADIEKSSSVNFMNTEMFEVSCDRLNKNVNEIQDIGHVNNEVHEFISETAPLRKDTNGDIDIESHCSDICHSDNLIDDIKKFNLDIENDSQFLANRKINARRKVNSDTILLNGNVLDISDAEYDDWLDSVKSKKHLNRSVFKNIASAGVCKAEANCDADESIDANVEFSECFETSSNNVIVSNIKTCENCISRHAPVLTNHVDRHDNASKDLRDKSVNAGRTNTSVGEANAIKEACTYNTTMFIGKCSQADGLTFKTLHDDADEFSCCFDGITEGYNDMKADIKVSHIDNNAARDTVNTSGLNVQGYSDSTTTLHIVASDNTQFPQRHSMCTESACGNSAGDNHDKKTELHKEASGISGSSQPTVSGLDNILSRLEKGKTSGIGISALNTSSRHFMCETSNTGNTDKDHVVKNTAAVESQIRTGSVSAQAPGGAIGKCVGRTTIDEEVMQRHPHGLKHKSLAKSPDSQMNIQNINSILVSLGKQKASSTFSQTGLMNIKTSSRHLYDNEEGEADDFGIEIALGMTIQSKHTDNTPTPQPIGTIAVERSSLLVRSTVSDMHDIYPEVNNTAMSSSHDLQNDKGSVLYTKKDKLTEMLKSKQLGKSQLDLKTLNTNLSNSGISQCTPSMAVLSRIKTRSRHMKDEQFGITTPHAQNSDCVNPEDSTGRSSSCHNDTNNAQRQQPTTPLACTESDKVKRIHVHELEQDASETQMNQYLHSTSGAKLGIHDVVTGLCFGADRDIVTVIEDIVLKAVDASDNAGDFTSLNMEQLYCHSVVGASHRHSRLVDGLVTVTLSDNVAALRTLDMPCNALIVNGDITPLFKHKGYKKAAQSSTVVGVEDLLHGDHVAKTDQWLSDMASLLDELNVGIILARGQICDEAQSMCATTRRITLSSVPYHLLDVLCETSQTDMVTYVAMATEINVCKNVTVLPWQPDWMDRKTFTSNSKQEVIISIDKNNPQTVVFSEPTHPLADLKEQEFWDCLHRVTSTFRNGSLIPGGGRTEAQCVEHCLQRTGVENVCDHSAEPWLDYLPQGFEVLAGAFQDYVRTVTTNIAQTATTEEFKSVGATCDTVPDFVTTTTDHRAKSEFSNMVNTSHFSGLEQTEDKSHLSNGLRVESNHGNSELNFGCEPLYDDYTSKIEAWRVAMETVVTVLQTDSYIVTGITQDEIRTKLGGSVLTL